MPATNPIELPPFGPGGEKTGQEIFRQFRRIERRLRTRCETAVEEACDAHAPPGAAVFAVPAHVLYDAAGPHRERLIVARAALFASLPDVRRHSDRSAAVLSLSCENCGVSVWGREWCYGDAAKDVRYDPLPPWERWGIPGVHHTLSEG